MKIKRLGLIFACLGIFFFLESLVPCGGACKTIRIKMATLAPRGSDLMKIMEEMDAAVRKATDNSVEFVVFYGGVQGDETEVLRKIRMGQLHGGSFTGYGLGQIVPEVRVTEIPYVFWNTDEVNYVRKKLQPYMDKRFEEAGFIVLGWSNVGFVYNFSKVPIVSLDVARQQKWWMWEGDPLSKAVFDAFGIHPIPLSFTEVMTSLQTKMIDAASTTPYGAVAFRWYTRFSYMDEYPITNVLGATIVSKRIWKRIPKEYQKKILKLCPGFFARIQQYSRVQNKKSIKVLKKSGIKVVPFNPDDATREFIFNAAKKARESLVGKIYSRELLDRTLALLAEYRAAHPEKGIEKIE